MSQKNFPTKTRRRIYLRPVFILLLVTIFLWLAFLFKVFFVSKTKETADSSTPTFQLSSNVTAAKTPSKQTKSRNKNTINTPENREEAALRESFENTNPKSDNKIMRGEIEPVEDISGNLLNALDAEMDSLNKDYKRALKETK